MADTTLTTDTTVDNPMVNALSKATIDTRAVDKTAVVEEQVVTLTIPQAPTILQVSISDLQKEVNNITNTISSTQAQFDQRTQVFNNRMADLKNNLAIAQAKLDAVKKSLGQ